MKTAVIGVGHLGKLHTKMYAQLPSSELIGVYDVNQEQAQTVAGEFKTRAWSSMEDLIREADAISVVTSTPHHHDVAMKVIAAGKHLFIEKPITTTLTEARAVIDAARSAGVTLQVGHIERFNPAVLALEKYDIKPMFIESHRLAQFKLRGSDVAVVLDLMIHDIDIILHLVRSPVTRVDANGVGIVSGSIDIANARLQFENGCVANVTASRISQRPMRKMRIFQENAYLSVDFSEGNCEVFRLASPDEPSGGLAMMLGQIDVGPVKRNIVYEQPEKPDVNALSWELDRFLKAAATGTEPPVTGEDGYRALEVAQMIIREIQTNLKKIAVV
ncbi:MAG: Gfo/Idh/MocA family oxidoreductase [Bacteroidetes bacterium]|nr:Gfo/Idh/MocA family oxidoreductase [Bacteroidota bacterium]